jgi:spoIIIJ-associated protein
MTIQAYLENFFQHLGFDEGTVAITVSEAEEKVDIQIDVPEEEVGMVIGHRGETLAALQRMARLVFRDEYAEKHIVLNLNDYRQERIQQLQEKVRAIGAEVLETGKTYVFPYLSSYERFIVHSELNANADLQGLESISEGEGKDRRLTIQPKAV